MARYLRLSLIALQLVLLTTTYVKGQLSDAFAVGPYGTNDVNVPVKAIPKTQLYTGIYYTLRLERFESGWITWSDAKRDPAANRPYMMLDKSPDRTGYYSPGGAWYKDVQWFFVESETSPGWYTLRNRQIPNRAGGLSKLEHVGSGYPIVLSWYGEPSEPDDLLWKPVRQSRDNNDAYKLVVKSKRQGIVTWSETRINPDDVPESYYMQVDVNNNRDYYAENGPWYEDSVFNFKYVDTQDTPKIRKI